MVVCNIDGCDKDAKGSWLDNRMFLTYACTRHFKKYHLMLAKDVPLKAEVMAVRKR